jgi:predicted DNA-binding transcriptional regulator AlpA
MFMMTVKLIQKPIKLAPALPAPIHRKLPTAQVLVMLGIGKPTLDLLRKREDFPRPYRYSESGRLVWDEGELLEWLEARRVAGGPDHAA